MEVGLRQCFGRKSKSTLRTWELDVFFLSMAVFVGKNMWLEKGEGTITHLSSINATFQPPWCGCLTGFLYGFGSNYVALSISFHEVPRKMYSKFPIAL